jgi:RNA polymerase sigma-70 factor (ECF subfamily)
MRSPSSDSRTQPVPSMSAWADGSASTANQPYHAAGADLLARAGRRDATVAAYDRAIELTANLTERRFLERQRKAAADRT